MIDRRGKIILYGIGVLLVLLIIFEFSRPRPINWNYSFTSGDKIPYGAYILYDQLPNIFPDQEIQNIDKTPIDFLKSLDSVTNANYVFINNYLYFDKVEAEYLMDFASRGNKVFISAYGAYGPLADTLELEVGNSKFYADEIGDTIRTRLVNQDFKDRTYIYDKGSSYTYLEAYDTLATTVLGEVLPVQPNKDFLDLILSDDKPESEEPEDEDSEVKTVDVPQVNFVEVAVGEGAIYYNLNPIAFTNYYMLKGKQQYALESLSYLNDGPIYFDDYGKSGRKVVTSPLRFVLSQPSLKWAYFLALAAVLLYMVFGSKRRQRIIPVVTPLENSTVEFTRTIGSLYFQSGDHTGILTKQINYFLENIRSHYYLSTQELNNDFIERLSVKSGVGKEQTADLINYISSMRNKPSHLEFELKQLNKKIEAFKKKAGI
jgi:hypothetical protein